LATVWLAAGSVPAPPAVQRESATVVPSDWVHETVRVCTSLIEQVLESLPHAPVVQEYPQSEVSEKVCESEPSTPQEKSVVGVQVWLVAGSVVVQFEFATVVPSER
jgi:hypothetical protein